MSRLLVSLVMGAALLSLSGPAFSASLACQVSVVQGTNCIDIEGDVSPSAPLYVAVTCNLCTGSGSNVQCDTVEHVNAANLVIMNANNVVVSGSFSAAGTSCIGKVLYKWNGGALPVGGYKLVAKNVSGITGDQVIFTFNVGGVVRKDTGGVPPPGDFKGTTQKDITVRFNEAGIPIAVDGRVVVLDEKGNPITPPPPGEDGCGCALATPPRAVAPLVLLLGLALLARRRRR